MKDEILIPMHLAATKAHLRILLNPFISIPKLAQLAKVSEKAVKNYIDPENDCAIPLTFLLCVAQLLNYYRMDSLIIYVDADDAKIESLLSEAKKIKNEYSYEKQIKTEKDLEEYVERLKFTNGRLLLKLIQEKKIPR